MPEKDSPTIAISHENAQAKCLLPAIAVRLYWATSTLINANYSAKPALQKILSVRAWSPMKVPAESGGQTENELNFFQDEKN